MKHLKLITIGLAVAIAVTGCSLPFSKKSNNDKNNLSDNEIDTNTVKTAKIGNLVINYTNKLTKDQSSIFRNSDTTYFFYDSDTDFKIGRNDEFIKYPVFYIEALNKPENIETLNDIKEAIGINDINDENIKEYESCTVVKINTLDKNDTYNIARNNVYIIPKDETDEYIYHTVAVVGTAINDNKLSGTKFLLSEEAYNIITKELENKTNEKVYEPYDIVASALDTLVNSLESLGSTENFKSSNISPELGLITSGGVNVAEEIEKSSDETYTEPVIDYEAMEEEFKNYTPYGLDIDNSSKQQLSQEDLITNGKLYYTVGVDIEPGEYYVTNLDNSLRGTMLIYTGDVTPTYTNTENTDENIEEDTEDTIAQVEIQHSDDTNIIYNWSITDDDPEGYNNESIVTLFEGYKIEINGLKLEIAKITE